MNRFFPRQLISGHFTIGIPNRVWGCLQSLIKKDRLVTKIRNTGRFPKLGILIWIILTSVAYPLHAQWKLAEDQNGIRVYTATKEGTNRKRIRVECTLKATTNQIVALMKDIPSQPKWVYRTQASKKLRSIDRHNLIYYSIKDMPWPVSDRDIIVDMRFRQDQETGTIYMESKSLPNYIPKSKKYVRVPYSLVNWEIKPLGDSQIQITYTAEADPGGSIPDWIINMFITKGPLETFERLPELLKASKYIHSPTEFE